MITAVRRRPLPVLAAACAVVGLVTLVVVLRTGGSLEASGGHSTAAGGSTWVSAAASAALLAVNVAAIVTIGWLAMAALVLDREGGPLSDVQRRCLRPAAWTAGAWMVCAALALLLTTADAAGVSVRDALDTSLLSQFIGQVDQSKALFYVGFLALCLAVLTPGTRSSGTATALLAVAIAGLSVPVMGGHAGSGHSSGGETTIALSMITLHVTAVAVWVGGLVALLVLARSAPDAAIMGLPRFSTIALICFVVVGASGVVTALTRVSSFGDLFGTSYGVLVVVKAGLFAVLAAAGSQQRRRVVSRIQREGAEARFRRLAAVEVILMTATVAVAVGLARTPPPVG